MSGKTYISRAIGRGIVPVNFRPGLARQGMAAAGVRPNIGECDFAGSPLLQQQLILLVEEEDTEGTVQDATGLVFVEFVDIILAGMAQDLVGVIYSDALVCGHEVQLAPRPCSVLGCQRRALMAGNHVS